MLAALVCTNIWCTKLFLFIFRAICDDTFQGLEEKEKIFKFSCPKILRLIEIIRCFKPKLQKQEIVSINDTGDSTSMSVQAVHKDVSDKSNGVEVCSNIINETDMPSLCTVLHKNSIDKSNSTVKANGNSVNETDLPSQCTVVNKNSINKSYSAVEVNGNGINEADLQSLSTDVHQNSICKSNSVIKANTNGINETDMQSLCTLVHKNSINKSNSTVEVNGNHINEADSHSDEECKPLKSLKDIADERNVSLDAERQAIVNNTNVSSDEATSKKCNQEDLAITGKGLRFRGKGRGSKFQKKSFTSYRSSRTGLLEDGENLCAIIFVEDPFTAKMLFHLLNVSNLYLFQAK